MTNVGDTGVAIVTGATSRIGSAIAAELADKGYTLVVTGRRGDALATVAGQLKDGGAAVATAVGDVTDPDHAQHAVQLALSMGSLTLLVNNAGGVPTPAGPDDRMGRTIAESDPAVWSETMRINLGGPYLFARASLPIMLAAGRGRIVTVASRAGTGAVPGAGNYIVAKTAVIRLTEVIAEETRGSGVSAFSIHPGGVANARIAEAAARGEVSLDRFPDPPEAAARLVAALASGRYDVLSGAYLDIADDLDDLTAHATTDLRRLGVRGLPDELQIKPLIIG